MNRAFDPTRESLYQIAGDAPDPTGLTRNRGIQSSVDPNKPTARPLIRYKDVVIEADLYGGENGIEPMVILLCPMCRNSLRITTDRKAIEWRPESQELSIEAFGCTWERGRGTEETKDDRMLFGTGLCRWKVAVDKNIAKDA